MIYFHVWAATPQCRGLNSRLNGLLISLQFGRVDEVYVQRAKMSGHLFLARSRAWESKQGGCMGLGVEVRPTTMGAVQNSGRKLPFWSFSIVLRLKRGLSGC